MDTMVDGSIINESNSNIAMETGVRYRKETPDNGDSVDEDVNTETVEMVAIMAESDKTELISPQSNEDKESSQHVCTIHTV